MSRVDHVVSFFGTRLRETTKAVHFSINMEDGSEEKVWFPMSQTIKLTLSNQAGQDCITVTQWIAQQKGLI